MLSRHALSAPIRCVVLWGLPLLLLDCAVQDRPKTEPPPSSEAGKVDADKPHSPIPVTLPEAPEPAQAPTTTVVVESGVDGGSSDDADVVSIARAEKERRSKSSPPKIVVTNETLLRRPGPKPKTDLGKKGGAQAASPPAASQTDNSSRETQADLWKARARDIRTRLKESTEKVEKLRRLTASMRERFYLTPPQFGRDDSLWQEWGRLQESYAEAERSLQSMQKELEVFLEEGRSAGADPGWLATGEELLIKKQEATPSPPVQAIEPPVIPPPGDPR